MAAAAFHILTKPVGPICNLDCRYCFYLEKEALYPEASTGAGAGPAPPALARWAMAPAVLENYIRQYIEEQQNEHIRFAWQGGEPTLLGVDYFRRVVELQARYGQGKRIENALQTNGVLLDDAWCEFFAANRFLIGISIDGPPALHDAYRVDKGGQPTFGRVLRGLEALKRHGVEFNTLTTVHRKNGDHPLEVYRFLREHGSGHIQFIPIVERIARQAAPHGMNLVTPDFDGAAAVSAWSVEPRQFGRFLCAIFDEWVRHDVGRTFVQLFDVALEMWCGMQASLCVFRPTCGGAMAIEHNGDLYSCDHFVYPEHKLGNIMQTPMGAMATSAQQVAFGQAKHDTLPEYCRRCEVRFACNGECPKHRFLKTPEGEPGLNYLCAGYKMFFNHIDPYMRFMAAQLRQEQAPANVMAWTRARDAEAAAAALPRGRNDPCPCGSGQKYKRCCGRSA